jgi:hypothetical protein
MRQDATFALGHKVQIHLYSTHLRLLSLFIRVIRDLDQFITLDGLLLVALAGAVAANLVEEVVICDSGLKLRGGSYVIEEETSVEGIVCRVGLVSVSLWWRKM